jgi:hypothetical protein
LPGWQAARQASGARDGAAQLYDAVVKFAGREETVTADASGPLNGVVAGQLGALLRNAASGQAPAHFSFGKPRVIRPR